MKTFDFFGYFKTYFYFRYLSNCLLISGTKKIIQKKTVGQANKNLAIKFCIKFVSELLKYTITNETVVLVQNDIIKAKIINLYFFMLTFKFYYI